MPSFAQLLISSYTPCNLSCNQKKINFPLFAAAVLPIPLLALCVCVCNDDSINKVDTAWRLDLCVALPTSQEEEWQSR
jgi:hypothetical protein